MPWILVARATRIESFQPLNATEHAPASLYNNALYVFNCNSLCNSLYLSDSNAKYANPFIHSCIPMHPIHQYYTPTHNSCIHSYPNHSLMQYNSQDTVADSLLQYYSYTRVSLRFGIYNCIYCTYTLLVVLFGR